MRRLRVALALSVVVGLGSTGLFAAAAPPKPKDAGARDASAPSSDAGANAADAEAPRDGGAAEGGAPVASPPAKVSGCVETIPNGASRPFVTEAFPPVGTSGFAATLAITVRHGKGERVLPSGLDLANATEMKKVLHDAGFGVPDPTGTAAARLYSEGDATTTTTHLDFAVVLLPSEPGSKSLTLPALPIAIARANGEHVTLCTKTHTILVDDPLQNVPEAKPKPNPDPRPQREEWTTLKKALQFGSLGLLAGALLAYVGWKIATKPKPVPPPPPPRPPWEVALEKLDEIRHAGLLDAQRYTEYFDRTSDAVRGYLGARFGFDGLESTTDEALAALLKHGGGFIRLDVGTSGLPAPGIPLTEISAFLRECDLVKFANLTPTPEQCESSLLLGERIVRATMPVSPTRPPPPPPASSLKVTM